MGEERRCGHEDSVSQQGRQRLGFLDSCGINLNLITQLPSEPEPGCVQALPRYVLHSNRTDLLILNENAETKHGEGQGKCQTRIREQQPLIFYRLISLARKFRNMENEKNRNQDWSSLGDLDGAPPKRPTYSLTEQGRRPGNAARPAFPFLRFV